MSIPEVRDDRELLKFSESTSVPGKPAVSVVNPDGSNIGGSSGLSAYRISDADESGTLQYWGFLKSDGSWYVLRKDITGTIDPYRYAKGSSGYTTAWAGRVGLTYDYYNVIFP